MFPKQIVNKRYNILTVIIVIQFQVIHYFRILCLNTRSTFFNVGWNNVTYFINKIGQFAEEAI